MTAEELTEKYALVKKLKSELKNEEMALVLLKKLKQSQTIARESTTVSGGATLTPASKATKDQAKAATLTHKTNNDLAMAKELVSSHRPHVLPLCLKASVIMCKRSKMKDLAILALRTINEKSAKSHFNSPWTKVLT